MKMHEMKTAVINGSYVNYFYTKEKHDTNGNSRFRVYIMDPDASAVYEILCKTYETFIADHVRKFIEGVQN